MGLNLDAVGMSSEPSERSWDRRDALLYALGVGAGALDPTGFELEFTTENTAGLDQKVLPTFATIVGQGGRMMADLGDIDMTKLVHGEQAIILHGEIPVSGTTRITTTVAGMYDKGSAGLVVLESESVDAATGVPAFTTRTGLFIREAGGFGGPRGPEGDEESALAGQPLPTREPDERVSYAVRTDQALLYRLNGDRNPLHSDPTFAQRAGFDRPDPARVVHLRIHRPRVAAHGVRFGPGPVRVDAGPLLATDTAGRHPHHFGLGRGRPVAGRLPVPHREPAGRSGDRRRVVAYRRLTGSFSPGTGRRVRISRQCG